MYSRPVLNYTGGENVGGRSRGVGGRRTHHTGRRKRDGGAESRGGKTRVAHPGRAPYATGVAAAAAAAVRVLRARNQFSLSRPSLCRALTLVLSSWRLHAAQVCPIRDDIKTYSRTKQEICI